MDNASLLAALWPTASLVLLGTFLRVVGLIKSQEWAPIEKIVYFVTFPCVIFLSLAGADISGQPVGRFAVVLITVMLGMLALSFVGKLLFGISGPAFSALAQGVVRWNTYVVISLVPSLFGADAVPLAALAVALMVPLANVISVSILARYGDNEDGQSIAKLLTALARNPLVIACALGITWNLLALPLPDLLEEPLSLIARATLALGLMAVGAALRPISLSRGAAPLGLAVVGQLAIKPYAALMLCRALDLGPEATGVAVLACAVPTASSSYILTRIMRGDAELMAAMITLQTLVAFATIPVVLALVLQ